MADQSDPLIRRSELVAFQEEMLRKMFELLKDQCAEQRREVGTMLAAINASVLTGSITPPTYTSIHPHNRQFQPTPYNSIPLHHPKPTLLHHPDLPQPLTTDHWELFYGSRPRPMKTSPPTSNDTILSNTHHASRLKADIPVFYGLTNNEVFVDWVADIEDYFAYVPIDDSTTAQLVELRLKGCAKAWLRQT
ncbi:hypothetical protein ZOSMA_528G00020 [Zostera marina]|uniref:Retrotransposon gag domain-containing protein n=1 Tax=Zostera marina TaxID=29655 RepID=A0A0K9NXK8_ZOSMR|nr:hypothetical protein ZOSMA_528G00020 [Zostera marina]